MSKSYLTQSLALALVLIFMTVSIHAEVPQIINYQGRLTDDTGAPITGSVSMNFTIFNHHETGDAVWSSGDQLIQVTDGLFSYELGSAYPIPESIFNENQLYLSISVGSESEMSRKQLITVPYAFNAIRADTAQYASNVEGVSTQPGAMLINNDAGDSAIILSSELISNLSRIYMIDPGDDGRLLELVCNHATNEAGIYLIDPGDDGHTISLTSSLNAGSFKMFNPQPEPPAVLFEVNASSTNGASLSIYDEIGQVMGFEPMPFNQGYGMKLIDPGDDGKLLELIGNHATNEAGIYLIDPGDDGHTISLTSSLNAGSFKMFNPQPEPPAVMFEVNASSTNGASLSIYDEIGQVMGFEPSPFNQGYGINLIDPGDDGKLVEISSSYLDGIGSGRLSVYDDLEMLESHLEPGNLTLQYDNGGATGPPVYLNATNAAAQIGIGTNAPTEALYVVGNIYATGSITELSDAAVKTNVEDIDNALELVDNLRGVRYNLDSDLAGQLNTTEDRQIGLIAQEVKEVLPEVVNSPKEGYSSVDYSRLTAVLIEAVKELKAENEKLKSRIEKLEHQ